jgi:riboflavin kinase/FMN adenylyltransferase
MRIFKGLEHIDISSPVVTIGTFDGVHLGHQKIITRLNEEARKSGGESVLFTFFPHPRMVIYPESHGLKLLQTQEEKLDKLERMGLQNLIIYPFDFEFSRKSAIEFVRDILVNKLHIHRLVIGYDHQFGRNREGTIEFLKNISELYEFEVVEIPAEEIDAINVSSTKIRDLIVQGRVDRAAEFLGAPYTLKGKVIKGDQLGRTIGYPTANLEIVDSEKLIPGNGVYAVTSIVNSKMYCGMMNIGFRPTVSLNSGMQAEVHLFDFDQDIYGLELEVHFIQKIREEQKFIDIEGLRHQLQNDEKTARIFLMDCAH